MERKAWTDDDIAKLQSMARRYPTAQIAAALGRGISSTITKAHERRISLRINSRRESDHSNLDPGPAGMDLKS